MNLYKVNINTKKTTFSKELNTPLDLLESAKMFTELHALYTQEGYSDLILVEGNERSLAIHMSRTSTPGEITQALEKESAMNLMLFKMELNQKQAQFKRRNSTILNLERQLSQSVGSFTQIISKELITNKERLVEIEKDVNYLSSILSKGAAAITDYYLLRDPKRTIYFEN